MPSGREAPVRDAPEIVLSYGLWQRRFGADPDVVGKTVIHEGRSAMTIVGVMPQGFDFPGGIEAWRQDRFDRPLGTVPAAVSATTARWRGCGTARSIGEARAELATMAGALAIEFPKSNAGYGVRVDEPRRGDGRASEARAVAAPRRRRLRVADRLRERHQSHAGADVVAAP